MSLSPSGVLGKDVPSRPTFSWLLLMNYPLPYNMKCNKSNLTGVTLGPGCPIIHSLLFADDLILCGKATKQEAANRRTILKHFCVESGQVPNLQKSAILFSKNANFNTRNITKNIFPVPDLHPHTLHLGHPIIFNHNDRNKAYNFILNKFKAKLTTVRANKLNHGERLTYIQSVQSSIPVYYMSTVLLSKSFVQQKTMIIRRFWWTGVQEDNPTSPIAYRSWEDICESKENGGLGIRDLEMVNKSLIIHAAYNIANNKNPLLTSVLKAKYFPNSFWTATNIGTRSIF